MNRCTPDEFSFYSHAIGALVSLFATLFLAAVTRGSPPVLALSLTYGLSVTTLFAASSLYHAFKREDGENSVWRKLDHLAIFIMITGTYIPMSYIFLDGPWKWGVITAQWSLVVLGGFFKFFFIRTPRALSAGIYLAMGWMALLIIGKIINAISTGQTVNLFAGALCFTAGAVIYMMKRPDPLPERVGFHGLFHILVLMGGVFHFIMIYEAVSKSVLIL